MILVCTPLEAATFGKPSAVLRWGGFLDTLEEGEIGIFFETDTPEAIAAAMRGFVAQDWDGPATQAHAARSSEARFVERIRSIAGVGVDG
jgi:glycosyltransferase involved in cell wall biosynthesis